MRKLADCRTQYSPKDLLAFLEGDFSAWCERYKFEGGGAAAPGIPAGIPIAPDVREGGDDLAARMGDEHEKRHLAKLRAEFPDLVEIDRRDEHAARHTLDAMGAGASVIYQACLTDGDWQGYPDLLYKIPGPSNFGDYHYEPRDVKLARSAKPAFIVQLCCYAGMLEAMQGVRPKQIKFIFGDSTEESFKTDDFYFYYLVQRDAFLEFQKNWRRDNMPDPGLERSYGQWSTFAEQLLEERDHLSRVAGITRSQIRRLEDAGINTLKDFADSTIVGIPRISPETLTKLRRQAALQQASRALEKPLFELRAPLPSEPGRGLALLPPPRPLDVFFDMEGFPFYPGGLEYLFGAVTVEDGKPKFHDWWAHSPEQEKKAFEGFVDFAHARWQQDPEMHVYHYAAYEKTALRRLMGKYATRENEVDDLLRNEVLVDLYNIVRQGVTIGATGYSLKEIECLYMPPREQAVSNAGDSVLAYQAWVDSGEPQGWAESARLNEIREYNRVDCESTVGVRDWLIKRKAEFDAKYPESTRPTGREPKPPREPAPAEAVAKSLADQARAEPDRARARVTELLGWLVEYHRREDKPVWWSYYDRLEKTEEQLRDDFDCLTGLVRTERPARPEKQSFAYEYRFDPDSDTKLKAGSTVVVTEPPHMECSILTMDTDAGLLELKLGAGRTLPDRVNLIPKDIVPAKAIKDSLLRFAEQWAKTEEPFSAISDLLFRRTPRVHRHAGGALVENGPDSLRDAVDVVCRLDGSTLCIQGPPGAGKTYTAAAMIVELMRRGKRVGITSHTHKAIMNVMSAILRCEPGPPIEVKLFKVGKDDDEGDEQNGRITRLSTNEKAEALFAKEGPFVLGGTAWVFSRPSFAGALDYLFIDEAGQVSLANAVAMGQSAKNIVLIGDQMQLAQPLKGTHPGESGMSCLEYALNGHATIPPDFGIFLGLSYRMHPDVCAFISDAFYEARLKSAARTERNAVGTQHGIVWMPVEHEGNSQSSEEEASAIVPLVKELLARSVSVEDKPARAMTADDVLLVAPFNMQVRNLRGRLDPGVRVGSVDKFQGQEAPVVIVSLCSSTLEDSPRGAEFLLSANRLNVAVSRAKAVAVVVGSPGLMAGRCKSIEAMQQVNVLCRLSMHGRAYAEVQ